MNAIDYEAGEGRFKCVFYDFLAPEAKSMLEENGYKIKNIKTGVNEYGWEIEW